MQILDISLLKQGYELTRQSDGKTLAGSFRIICVGRFALIIGGLKEKKDA